MWLINTQTIKLEEFIPEQCPPYAILSHRWEQEEVLFRDMQDLRRASKKKGFRKIQQTCLRATRQGLRYAWVDTCCINKDSSAELSEAINSMFRWYRKAQICYVYLFDVDGSDISKSAWFERGWTLQELLAPAEIEFLDSKWRYIGRKQEMLQELSDITTIDRMFLASSRDLCRCPYATRMGWAAKRKTTRREDVAYCLLGIMDINMPLLYGEGDRAFQRLQEEILRRTNEGSLFGWPTAGNGTHFTTVLAKSPSDFMDVNANWDRRKIDLTSDGVTLTLPIRPFIPDIYVAHSNNFMDGRRVVLFLLRVQLRTQQLWVRLHSPELESLRKSECFCPDLLSDGGPVWYDEQSITISSRNHVGIIAEPNLAMRFGFTIRSWESLGKFNLKSRRSTCADIEAVASPDKRYTITKAKLNPGNFGVVVSFKVTHPLISRLAFGFSFDGFPFLAATTHQASDFNVYRFRTFLRSFQGRAVDKNAGLEGWRLNIPADQFKDQYITEQQRQWQILDSDPVKYPDKYGIWCVKIFLFPLDDDHQIKLCPPKTLRREVDHSEDILFVRFRYTSSAVYPFTVDLTTSLPPP